MEEWGEDEPREPRPLRVVGAEKRSFLDVDDQRELVKMAVKVGAMTLAVLWTALVLGLGVGMAKLSFCALAGCQPWGR